MPTSALLIPRWFYIKVHLYLRIIHHFYPHDISFNLSRKSKWLKGPFWRADTHRSSPTTHFWQENSAIPPQAITWPISVKGKKNIVLWWVSWRENSVFCFMYCAHWLKRSNSSLATYNVWHQAAMSLNFKLNILLKIWTKITTFRKSFMLACFQILI